MRDIVAAVGLGLLWAGCALLSLPVSFIVVGGLLLLGCIWGAINGRDS